MSTIHVSAYTVYPTGWGTDMDGDGYLWTLAIEDRGKGWAVIWRHWALNSNNEWDHEPIPSMRDNAYYATHRFTEDEAKCRATAIIDGLVINGRTYKQAAEYWKATQ